MRHNAGFFALTRQDCIKKQVALPIIITGSKRVINIIGRVKELFMKKIILSVSTIIINLVLISSALGQTRNISNVDTPTAFTIGKGTYLFSLLGYDNGGMEIKGLIGLHENLYLGVSLDLQNALGKDKPQPNIPGVIARIKFTDGWESWPISIAIGYDSFFIGQQGKRDNPHNSLNRMMYGPYLAITKPIYLFDDEQYVSYGVRLPTQPDFVPDDTSYYLALDFPLNELFRVKTEFERVYWSFRDPGEWLMNFGIRYTYMDQLGIEFDILYQFNDGVNRVLRIEYYDRF
jgi:hypothetical protein